jgi:hypothetical protein
VISIRLKRATSPIRLNGMESISHTISEIRAEKYIVGRRAAGDEITSTYHSDGVVAILR